MLYVFLSAGNDPRVLNSSVEYAESFLKLTYSLYVCASGITPQCILFQAKYYLLTNWFAYLYERMQSPRSDVMPDRRESIVTQAS